MRQPIAEYEGLKTPTKRTCPPETVTTQFLTGTLITGTASVRNFSIVSSGSHKVKNVECSKD